MLSSDSAANMILKPRLKELRECRTITPQPRPVNVKNKCPQADTDLGVVWWEYKLMQGGKWFVLNGWLSQKESGHI